MPFTLDKIDHHILSILQQNARVTNASLANTVGLSPAATLERVRKLESQQIIKSYHAKLDLSKLHLNACLLVQVKLHQPTQTNVAKFVKALADLPEVVESYQVVGEADFVIKVVTQDISTYQQFLTGKLSNVAVIQALKPLIVTNTLKEGTLPISASNS